MKKDKKDWVSIVITGLCLKGNNAVFLFEGTSVLCTVIPPPHHSQLSIEYFHIKLWPDSKHFPYINTDINIK